MIQPNNERENERETSYAKQMDRNDCSACCRDCNYYCRLLEPRGTDTEGPGKAHVDYRYDSKPNPSDITRLHLGKLTEQHLCGRLEQQLEGPDVPV